MLTLVLTAVVLAASPHLCEPPPHSQAEHPEPEWLAQFGEADQARIATAAKDFVVDNQGVFWDLQVENRKSELLARGEKQERILEAYGIGETAVWKSVPLWHAAAAGRTLQDPEIIESIKKSALPGFTPTDDLLVCVSILPGGEAMAERWEYSPGNKDAARPNYRRERNVIVRGHTFSKAGDELRPQAVKLLPSMKMGDASYKVLEIPDQSQVQAAFRPVTPEQLAAAILRGSAKLTQWSWERKNVPDSERGPKRRGEISDGWSLRSSKIPDKDRLPSYRFIWRARDVTPSLPAVSEPVKG